MTMLLKKRWTTTRQILETWLIALCNGLAAYVIVEDLECALHSLPTSDTRVFHCFTLTLDSILLCLLAAATFCLFSRSAVRVAANLQRAVVWGIALGMVSSFFFGFSLLPTFFFALFGSIMFACASALHRRALRA